MANTFWNTVDDLEADLYNISEMEKDFEPTPPPSIQQYKARMQQNYSSIYDTHDFDEDRILIGRGKNRPNILLRPGEGVVTDCNMEESIQKTIRATSGLGYSNELIQMMAKKESLKDDLTHISEHIKLKESNRVIKGSSPVHRRQTDSQSSTSSQSSQCNSPRRNNKIETENITVETAKPPPLSAMMKMAKEHKKPETCKKATPYWENNPANTTLNISSEIDFPPIKKM